MKRINYYVQLRESELKLNQSYGFPFHCTECQPHIATFPIHHAYSMAIVRQSEELDLVVPLITVPFL